MAKKTPSPEIVMRLLSGYQATQALKAAIELDLFTAVDEGARTSAALAKRCRASERGLRILGDFLTVTGLLSKKAGKYGLTPDSKAFLSRKSPYYLGSIANFLAGDELMDNYKGLADAVRRGGTTKGEGTVSAENPIWVEFARSMAPMMAMPARILGQLLKKGGPVGKILDIAAGHGLFGIEAARHDAKARVTPVDWAPVLAVARENAARAGLGGRYEPLAGSAFDVDFGGGFDTALVTNFLHHFDRPTNVKLLRKVASALKPGGRLAITEFVPNPDRVTPPAAATFSLVMLGSTPSGDAYTHAELDAMLGEAGFSRSKLTALKPTPQSALIARKP